MLFTRLLELLPAPRAFDHADVSAKVGPCLLRCGFELAYVGCVPLGELIPLERLGTFEVLATVVMKDLHKGASRHEYVSAL